MPFTFDASVTRDPDRALSLEWLETNGLGGWAGSTLSGAHTRRYHGWLVAANHPPVGRMVLLSKLAETLVVQGQRFELDCNRFPGTFHPDGFQFLQTFERDLFPVFTFQAGPVRLRRTMAAIQGENTTLVLYDVEAAPVEFTLELRPFVAARDYHALTHANPHIHQQGMFQDGRLRLQIYPGVPELFIEVPGSSFQEDPHWYNNFEYREEQQRGLDFHEDLFTHGLFRVTVREGDRLGVIVSTADTAGRDAFALWEEEQSRREKICAHPLAQQDFGRSLLLAADQFVVRRGQDLKTLIAGYHWFSDWGRDTMIALPGICLATGRFEDAKKILRAFAQSVSQGMLPNRFPDAGEHPEYNTVDATLWFFVAIQRYLQATGDEEFVRRDLLPALQNIVTWHEKGTRYGIRVDTDGLLCAGEPGMQLTWMDAKVGDWVVTPRQGKPVEINALWYNALMILEGLQKKFGLEAESKIFRQKARRVKSRFEELYWNPFGGYLFDCVSGEQRDAAIRPNQIFALSLPHPLLKGEKAKQILDVVERELFTPVGLRSLSPRDPHYQRRYGGDQRSRDGAYHQGTVWSWLLGPYLTALVRVRGAGARKTARQILEKAAAHLPEACVGSVSEIFDAEPPHVPRGCVAQAWGVGEWLRAWVEETER